MIRPSLPAVLLAVCLSAGTVRPSAAQSAPPAALTAADILHAVREGQSGRHEAFDGQLRDDSNDRTFPFRLTADGPVVRYDFAAKPPVAVQVRYGVDSSTLEESGPDGGKLSPGTFDKKILGTDLTYEDLALRFIYWSRATIEGDERVNTRMTWRLRLRSPTKNSQYSNVLLWVDKDSGALMQAESYDWQGKIIKKFRVVSGQPIAGKWYLKEMSIESYDPGTTHVHTRTYLEIKGLSKPSA